MQYFPIYIFLLNIMSSDSSMLRQISKIHLLVSILCCCINQSVFMSSTSKIFFHAFVFWQTHAISTSRLFLCLGYCAAVNIQVTGQLGDNCFFWVYNQNTDCWATQQFFFFFNFFRSLHLVFPNGGINLHSEQQDTLCTFSSTCYHLFLLISICKCA